ncbi:hypothetical protein Aduo_017529 [Ancylostoma duodenale]
MSTINAVTRPIATKMDTAWLPERQATFANVCQDTAEMECDSVRRLISATLWITLLAMSTPSVCMVKQNARTSANASEASLVMEFVVFLTLALRHAEKSHVFVTLTHNVFTSTMKTPLFAFVNLVLLVMDTTNVKHKKHLDVLTVRCMLTVVRRIAVDGSAGATLVIMEMDTFAQP